MNELSKNEEFLKSAFKGDSRVQFFLSQMNLKTFLAGYDLNSDGRVTVKEFRRIMVRTGNCRHHCQLGRTLVGFLSGKMSDGDIEKMIEKADVDNDG